MAKTKTDWLQKTNQTIIAKTKAFSDQDKKNYQIQTLFNIIKRMSEEPPADVNPELVQSEIEEVVLLLPGTPNQKSEASKAYFNKLTKLKKLLKEKFSFSTKGYYRSVWLPIGICLGVAWGNLFKNLAIGMPLGMLLGLAVGSLLDRKAEKDKRTI